MKLRFCLLLIVVLLVAGCGRKVALTPGQSPRLPMTGDTANYTTHAIMGVDNSGLPNDTDDTITIQTGTNHGSMPPPSIVQTFDIKHDTERKGASKTSITWLGLDAQYNAYLLGLSLDGKEWDLVTNQTLPLVYPATLKVGQSWSYDATFASGMTQSFTATVAGTEWLSTQAGKFETYKVDETITQTLTSVLGTTKTPTSGSVWISPQALGLDIQSNLSTETGGLTEKRKMHLKELILTD